ncbi:hypothetical protein L2E82_47507 [Cichorium intybus]|uniref:Uncharacterized protein n=1 Tax=Cichorium intybus TaxID=13427 RepID=A0ACB8YW91_CICIN|nr:hypothetical protein L2E82_47507 [Cichorium intybus]
MKQEVATQESWSWRRLMKRTYPIFRTRLGLAIPGEDAKDGVDCKKEDEGELFATHRAILPFTFWVEIDFPHCFSTNPCKALANFF